jgi:hypothetical protein
MPNTERRIQKGNAQRSTLNAQWKEEENATESRKRIRDAEAAYESDFALDPFGCAQDRLLAVRRLLRLFIRTNTGVDLRFTPSLRAADFRR